MSTQAQIDITQVQKGDIVRFKSYALRVETDPIRTANTIVLSGRSNVNGCPLIRRKFITGLTVKVDR